MKERISLTMDASLLREIDRRRGIIPRATYLNEEIRKAIAPAVPCQEKASAASTQETGRAPA